MTNKTTNPPPRPWQVLTAFAAVYVIWGSTYLGIRFADESIPPLLMAGSRNLAAGLMLYAVARRLGKHAPSALEWRDAFIAGGLMLTLGNGGVTWAEQKVSSSVTALLVALTPLWMVLFDWLRPNGTRPRVPVLAGLAVGFGGVAMLTRNPAGGAAPAYNWSLALLVTASLSWALGSIFNRQANKPSSPLLAVAMQMIGGGALLLALAFVNGEPGKFSFARLSVLSAGSWLYLTLAGSMIGYTAYVWLLHASTPARVATYAYVNPLIAVLLGCTIGHEPLSQEMLAAGALIIAAVVLIVRGGVTGKKPAPSPSSEAAT